MCSDCPTHLDPTQEDEDCEDVGLYVPDEEE